MRFVKLLQSGCSNIFKNNSRYSHMPTDSLVKTHLQICDRPMYRLTKMKFYCLPQRFHRKKLGSEIVVEIFLPGIHKNLLIFFGAKVKRLYRNQMTSARCYEWVKDLLKQRRKRTISTQIHQEKKMIGNFFWEMRIGSINEVCMCSLS